MRRKWRRRTAAWLTAAMLISSTMTGFAEPAPVRGEVQAGTETVRETEADEERSEETREETVVSEEKESDMDKESEPAKEGESEGAAETETEAEGSEAAGEGDRQESEEPEESVTEESGESETSEEEASAGESETEAEGGAEEAGQDETDSDEETGSEENDSEDREDVSGGEADVEEPEADKEKEDEEVGEESLPSFEGQETEDGVKPGIGNGAEGGEDVPAATGSEAEKVTYEITYTVLPEEAFSEYVRVSFESGKEVREGKDFRFSVGAEEGYTIGGVYANGEELKGEEAEVSKGEKHSYVIEEVSEDYEVEIVLDADAMLLNEVATSSVAIDEGSIVINGDRVTQNGVEVTIDKEKGLTVSGESTENNITVEGGEVKLTISDLTLSTEDAKSLIDIEGGSVELTLDGTNALSNAGGEKAVVRVSDTASLTVAGDGSLTINNGQEGDTEKEANGAGIGGNFEEAPKKIEITSGTIKVTEYGTSAAIGGGARADSGEIIISGGDIDVDVHPAGNSKNAGTGIGGGGENVKDTSAIGSGGSANITITGGTVNAFTESTEFLMGIYSSGAAIGSGENKGGSIYIGGDADVTAEAKNLACAIGSSNATWGGSGDSASPAPNDPMSITIEGNAVVKAKTNSLDYYGQGAYAGAAIGMSVQNLQPCTITIGGNADVTADGSWYGAGIGGSYVQINSQAQPIKITIKDNAVVDASAEVYGAAIGSGYGDSGAESAEIVIEGNPTITADGGWGGAGIGGAKGTSGGSIEINGGDITARGGIGGKELFGDIGGAGIGSGAVDDSDGYGAVGGDIYIGGTAVVKAYGGVGSAGIGGGNIKAVSMTGVPSVGEKTDENAGGVESITITGDAKVYAVGGKGASAIGGGAAYAGETDHEFVVKSLTIEEGTTVEAYADGTKYAIDRDVEEGKESITDSILNARFAMGGDDTLTPDKENPVNLLIDNSGNVQEPQLNIPADYYAFASTIGYVDTADHKVYVQNGENTAEYAYYGGNKENYTFNVKQGEMLTEDALRWTSEAEVPDPEPEETLTLALEDMVIYVGGDGYSGVVGEDAGLSRAGGTAENGIPEPLFIIDNTKEGGMPATIKVRETEADENGERGEWTFEKVSGGNAGKNYYRLSEMNEAPVRIQYEDEHGHVLTDDHFFNPDNAEDVYTTYYARIYDDHGTEHGEIFAGVTAEAGGTEYQVKAAEESEQGTLVIRAVENENEAETVVKVAETVTSPLKPETAAVTAPEGTTYTINDTGVPVRSEEGISLLFDDIIYSDGQGETRIEKIKQAVDEKLSELGVEKNGREYQIKFLDLVDNANGNVWVKASNPVDIYWGYPEGTDQNTKFYVIHLEGLHRDRTDGELTGFNPNDVLDAKREVMQVENTDKGITFSVKPGNFSPYILTWESGEKPLDPDDGDKDDGHGGNGGGDNGSGNLGTKENPYIVGVHGHWVHMDPDNVFIPISEAVPEGATPVTDPKWHQWKFYLNNGTILYDRWAYLYNPYAVNDQPVEGWFDFAADGIMEYGWYLDRDTEKWYYLHRQSDGMLGTLEYGWHHDEQDDKWYYLHDETGEMLLGWQEIGGKWYYFNPVAPEVTWNYNEATGGWTYNGSESRPYGSMYRAEMTPDGYYVDETGAWVEETAGGWYLNRETLDWYYYRRRAYEGIPEELVYGWHYDSQDGKWYYLDLRTGIMYVGWHEIEGKWYYFNPVAPEVTWNYNEKTREWEYNGSESRPYGSMYRGEETPDGYTVDESGARIR